MRFRMFKSGLCDDDWTIEQVAFVTLIDVIGHMSLWDDAEPEVVKFQFGDHVLDGMKSYRIMVEANHFRPNRRSDRIGLDDEWMEALRDV